MMRSRVRTAAVLAALSLLLASLASAQLKKEELVDTAMTGKIVALDASGGTLNVEGANGEKGVFHVNDKTTIMNQDKIVKLSDLEQGDHIVIEGNSKDGNTIATYIEVVDAPK